MSYLTSCSSQTKSRLRVRVFTLLQILSRLALFLQPSIRSRSRYEPIGLQKCSRIWVPTIQLSERPLAQGLVSVAGYPAPPSRSSAISCVIIQPKLRLHSDTGQFLNLSKVVLTRCPTFLTKMQFPRGLAATREFPQSHWLFWARTLHNKAPFH